MAKMGWYSGDHHVHAAGCGHYESPTEGVKPEDMWRHILGEDLDVGCVLSWGPCWYAQKKFFDGKIHPLSTRDYLMRYDIEVSGFPSSHAGHLCLLRLKEDDYPGTTRIEEWPSWDLPVLKWGKSQGGVVGFSHSGWGLKTSDDKLPSYEVPPYDGIGANEYIVDVVHDAVDFISTVDTPAPWELNIWYHTLNCGYRAKISGETDFPCIYGEQVGLGRVYVKLPDGQLDFDQWCEGVKLGRSYVSDGKKPPDRLPGQRPSARRIRQRAEARRAGDGQGDRPGGGPSRLGDLGRGPRDSRPVARAKALLGPRACPRGRDAQGARRGHRQRPTRRQDRDHRRRQRRRCLVRRPDQEVELGGAARLPVFAHQPRLRHGRRQADPRVEEIGRVVPQVSRPVLVQERAGDPVIRERGRQEGLRRRPRGLQEDPDRVRRRLTQVRRGAPTALVRDRVVRRGSPTPPSPDRSSARVSDPAVPSTAGLQSHASRGGTLS